jgi:hypothetical protein
MIKIPCNLQFINGADEPEALFGPMPVPGHAEGPLGERPRRLLQRMARSRLPQRRGGSAHTSASSLNTAYSASMPSRLAPSRSVR